MRNLSKVALATMLAFSASTMAFAAEYTKGVVKKVDEKAKKITIIHEPLVNLDMPAMTMVFRAGDDAMLTELKEGQNIEFIADRVKGKLTVIELK